MTHQDDALFAGRSEIKVRALFVGERIDLKALENTDRLAQLPLALRSGVRGCVVLFRYGVVVMFELDAMEQATLLNQLGDMIAQPYSLPESESATMQLKRGVESETVVNGIITVNTFNIERMQIVADVLAKSAVLSYYEKQIAQGFDSIEPLAVELSQGRYGRSAKALLKQIGQVLLINQKMIGRVEVSEKPDVLWDHPEIERLYQRLQDDYELPERHLALEQKLTLISLTVETVLDLANNNRAIRVEWYIVILIVVEIFLTLYELFFKFE